MGVLIIPSPGDPQRLKGEGKEYSSLERDRERAGRQGFNSASP